MKKIIFILLLSFINSLSVFPQCEMSEEEKQAMYDLRDALKEIYEEGNLSYDIVEWKGDDPCYWDGIGCHYEPYLAEDGEEYCIKILIMGIGDSTITTLPSSIGNLKGLEIIRFFSIFNFVALPKSVENWTNLKSAYRIRNIDLPKEFLQLPNLEELQMFNHTKTIDFSYAQNLKKLDIHLTNTTTLPKGITSLSGLKKLELDGYQIEAPFHLPQDITNLSSLNYLDLISFNIDSLPDFMGEFSDSLEVLLWRYNKTKYISPSLKNLKKIKKLFFDHNDISYLPPEINDLKSLTVLDLLGNELSLLTGFVKFVKLYG